MVDAAPPQYEIFVITPDKDTDGSILEVEQDKWLTTGNASILYTKTSKWANPKALVKLSRTVKPDIIYLNSFFSPTYSILPAVLCKLQIFGAAQLLVAPRGEFDQGALSIRAREKKVFLSITKILRLYSRAVWHASAALEERAIKKIWGKSTRVLISEDETFLPDVANPPVVKPGNEVRAVFLGRIAPKKGLLVALKAMGQISTRLTFNIYGPEEHKSYTKECKLAASHLPEQVTVNFHGPISPEEARTVFSNHDLFVFPTAGENFGHVIAEALSVSCIVMCSDHTPWSSTLRNGGGIVVEPSTHEEWKTSIESMAQMLPEELLRRRMAVAEAYAQWRQAKNTEHIFDLAHKPI